MQDIKENISDTQAKILQAAKTVFTRKGYDGASMQAIAREAGINKALLHYYYRSKDNLFDAVFHETFMMVFPDIESIFQNPQIPVFDKLRIFADKYITLLSENSFIPVFILQELTRNPERIAQLIENVGIQPFSIVSQIESAIEAGLIRRIDPRQVIINLLSLCVFPIVARPLLLKVFFQGDESQYQIFIEARKREVPEFLINSIKT